MLTFFVLTECRPKISQWLWRSPRSPWTPSRPRPQLRRTSHSVNYPMRSLSSKFSNIQSRAQSLARSCTAFTNPNLLQNLAPHQPKCIRLFDHLEPEMEGGISTGASVFPSSIEVFILLGSPPGHPSSRRRTQSATAAEAFCSRDQAEFIRGISTTARNHNKLGLDIHQLVICARRGGFPFQHFPKGPFCFGLQFLANPCCRCQRGRSHCEEGAQDITKTGIYNHYR